MQTTEIKKAEHVFPCFSKYRKNSALKFRGQNVSSWKLIPRAGRPSIAGRNDKVLFKHWKRRSIAYLQKENYTNWEFLAIANHTGVPTRLLDWSQNPLVAVFFACIENFDSDGAVYIYEPSGYVKMEEFDPFDIEEDTIYFVQPTASSDRIINQVGYFSIHNKPNFELTDKTADSSIEKVIIPKEFKKEIIFMLNQFGINNLTIYPDLEGLSKHLVWFYENNEYWDRSILEEN
jgi:hypothetical protein